MAEFYVHKAVELDKVKTARRRELSEPGYLDQHYILQPKYDGVCGVVDTNERVMRSRTNEVAPSCNHLALTVAEVFGPHKVVFGEVWKRETEQSKISGDFRRKSPAPWLDFMVFDVITLEEFDQGFSCTPYAERLESINTAILLYAGIGGRNRCVYPALYYGQGTYGRHEDMRTLTLSLPGFDGVVLRDPEGYWYRGRGTGGEIIKSKQVLSFDLRVVGVEEGEGKLAGHAGALLLRWKDGATIKAIGGTFEDRKAWLADPSSIVDSIVEVQAMAYSTDGLLREPRIKGIRYDKEGADFE